MDYGWLAIVGTVAIVVAAGYAIRNHHDAKLYRRLNRPWVGIGSLSSEGTLAVRIDNDEKSLWEITEARVVTPGHARLAVTGSYVSDGYGNQIPQPGAWKQNLKLAGTRGTLLHVQPVTEPIQILFVLSGRADSSQTTNVTMTAYPLWS